MRYNIPEYLRKLYNILRYSGRFSNYNCLKLLIPVSFHSHALTRLGGATHPVLSWTLMKMLLILSRKWQYFFTFLLIVITRWFLLIERTLLGFLFTTTWWRKDYLNSFAKKKIEGTLLLLTKKRLLIAEHVSCINAGNCWRLTELIARQLSGSPHVQVGTRVKMLDFSLSW